jgi:anhydro-N-acetylmuramic acid kinase
MPHQGKPHQGKIYKSIGLMSGTSYDGIDIGLIETDGEAYVKLLDARTVPYPKVVQNQISTLLSGDYSDLWCVEHVISDMHKSALQSFIHDFGGADVIGFHGQSIYHNPKAGICAQIGNPHVLSVGLKIDVIYDFRRRDVACGGNGAPLVPIFLKAINPHLENPVCFLNIGGVANICYISGDELIAFDVGCGNAPLNDICNKHLNLNYDNGGKLASSGTVHEESLQILCKDKYFSKSWPKSLDRNYFDFSILDNLSVQDMLATTVEFIASSIKFGVDRLPKMPDEIIVSGGGVHNAYLLARIADITKLKVVSSNIYNLPSDYLEAYAFAYLAVRSKLGLPISFPGTTGVGVPITGGILVRA